MDLPWLIRELVCYLYYRHSCAVLLWYKSVEGPDSLCMFNERTVGMLVTFLHYDFICECHRFLSPWRCNTLNVVLSRCLDGVSPVREWGNKHCFGLICKRECVGCSVRWKTEEGQTMLTTMLSFFSSNVFNHPCDKGQLLCTNRQQWWSIL